MTPSNSAPPVPRWIRALVGALAATLFLLLCARLSWLEGHWLLTGSSHSSRVLAGGIAAILVFTVAYTGAGSTPELLQAILRVRWARLAVATAIYFAVVMATRTIASQGAATLTRGVFLQNLLAEALQGPAQSLVAHGQYFGLLTLSTLLLTALSHRETARAQPGIAAVQLLTLAVLAIGSESRQFLNAWPFLAYSVVSWRGRLRPLELSGVVVACVLTTGFWRQFGTSGDDYLSFQGPWMNASSISRAALVSLGGLAVALFIFTRTTTHTDAPRPLPP